MSNFDFLKSFNNELYEIGVRLEEDVLNSPRAVTADATLFLENLVKDIYKLSNNKLESNLISFYKKIDNLYRLGVITYIFKNKLQDAYNLRNTIHKKHLSVSEEKKLAYDLDKRLFYISKKYFADYCENKNNAEIPDYKKPAEVPIEFENCIICGKSNKRSSSNMCKICNQKIENVNFMLSLKNNLKKTRFTRRDLIDNGINESRAILLLMDLSKYNAVSSRGEYYLINENNFEEYISEVNQYVEIGMMITKFYRDEIPTEEIIKSDEYLKGERNQQPFREFFKLVNLKIEKGFEKNLLKYKNIAKSIKLSSISRLVLNQWYNQQMEDFIDGELNDAFILYNEILISKFFTLKKKGLESNEILKKLKISQDIYNFWSQQFMGTGFIKEDKNIKKEILIKEIRKNRSLDDALETAGISENEFYKMYAMSKDSGDDFCKKFDKEFTRKRQKMLIRYLRKYNLNKAIRMSKITWNQFNKWYYDGESVLSDFYIKVTEILMKKYLTYRKNGWNKKEILKEIDVTKDMYNSWSNNDELYLYDDFESKNKDITSNLVKRGMIINGIKEGKSKEEAIFSANLTPREFMEIYNESRREKTEFYLRFDFEYEKNRKKLFTKTIPHEDFYTTIQKCEISQKTFNKWYVKDQNRFMSSNKATPFYLITTTELMNKYIQARLNGKNKPDAARHAGLSNITVKKWIDHPEFDLFNNFKKKVKDMNIDLIVSQFKVGKSKIEVNEICDIPIKTIDTFIEFGRKGSGRYEELFRLYENTVIPKHLEIFLKNFKSKNFYQSLKHAKLSEDEINYYYNMGKEGNDKFIEFSKEFLDTKIDLYVNSILAKKSSKIALKNSSLTKDEFEENRDSIDEIILNGRMNIIAEGLSKNKTNGDKLAKLAGISVDELYDWYLKGRHGDEKFKEFSIMFQLIVIIPRVMAYNKAKNIGIPQKWLLKRIKKEIGAKDLKIWEKYDFFNDDDLQEISIDGEKIDGERIVNALKKCEYLNVSVREEFHPMKSIRKALKDKPSSKQIFNYSK